MMWRVSKLFPISLSLPLSLFVYSFFSLLIFLTPLCPSLTRFSPILFLFFLVPPHLLLPSLFLSCDFLSLPSFCVSVCLVYQLLCLLSPVYTSEHIVCNIYVLRISSFREEDFFVFCNPVRRPLRNIINDR